ncbi:MAG: shikimate dehydrogenase [Anaerolineales bacterium]
MAYYRLGLIGWPVAHSLSPLIHRLALQASGLEGEYLLYPVDPQRFDEGAGELMRQLRHGELDGINVTVPHKQRVLAYTDCLTASARMAGAVNTLYVENGDVVGDNSDIPGFWMDLERLGWVEKKHRTAHSHYDTPGDRAIILGAGGAARAVAVAFAIHGCQVGLAARREEQAHEAAMELNRSIGKQVVMALRLDGRLGENFGDPVNIIVNATSAGMPPQTGVDPWPEQIPLPRGARLYDLVYNPPQTRLLQRARSSGLQAANGLGMLVGQAVLAFQRWTKQMPSFEAILHEVQSQIA